MLEHSSYIKDVVCDDNHIKVCFKTPEALTTVENQWKNETDSKAFNLVTYHIGCGHLTGEYRSFFHASQPVFDGECVTVVAELIDEQEAFHVGELSWGTYISPHLSKRQDVRGHVGVARPDLDEKDGDDTVDLTKDPEAVQGFFDTDIDTNLPDTYLGGLDSLSDEEYDKLVRRGLFSWIINGIKSLIGVSDHEFQILLGEYSSDSLIENF